MRRAGRRCERAAAIAALVLFAHAAQLVHLAAARHDVCPEHGDLVEHASATHAAAPAASAGGAPRWARASRRAAGAGCHDRCLIQLVDDQDVAPSLGRRSSSIAEQHPLSPPIGAAPAAARVRVYRFAPKSSPPA